MAHETIRRSTVQNCIAKAQQVNPVILQVDHDYWVVSSSTPGKGWLLERDPETGDLYCPCPGSQHVGCCYHRAALGLLLGAVPHDWIPAPASVYTYEVAS